MKYLGVDPFGPGLRVLYSSIEVNRQHELRAGLLPGVAVAKPVISLLHLNRRRVRGERKAESEPGSHHSRWWV